MRGRWWCASLACMRPRISVVYVLPTPLTLTTLTLFPSLSPMAMARFRWCARWMGRPEARRRTSLLYHARTSTPHRRTRSSAGRICAWQMGWRVGVWMDACVRGAPSSLHHLVQHTMHAPYHFLDVVARVQRQALNGTAPQELVRVVHAAGDTALHGVDAHLGWIWIGWMGIYFI